uniref:DC1 domain-containing protein n=1 Tax=Oryza brachyantha TaxID=4533 RepID=J3L802_ORYBR
MEQEIKGHPLHPKCPLVINKSGKRFVCNACKVAGSEMYIYSCAGGCDFNLHGQCATCPEKLSFWGHPLHELVLRRTSPDAGKGLLEARPDIHAMITSTMPKGVLPVGCEMCMCGIEGMHYACPASCGLLLHPVCAMLPKLVRSVAHEEHEMALFCSAPTMCVACRMPAIWAYRCLPCLAFYHLNCLPENDGMFVSPYKGCPPNPIFVPPPMMPIVSAGARAIFNEANPFGVIHSYRNRGL